MATKSEFQRLEKKLDELLEVSHNTDKEVLASAMRIGQIEGHLKNLNGRVTKNTERLSKLERIGLLIGGGGGVLALIYGIDATTLITKLIGG